jgi:hypothetical protein
MFTSTDFLNVSLAVGFLVLIFFISYTLIQVIIFIKILKKFILEIQFMRDGMKLHALTFIKNLLSRKGVR